MSDTHCDRCRAKLPAGSGHQIVSDGGEFERLCDMCMMAWWEDSKAHHPQSPPTK